MNQAESKIDAPAEQRRLQALEESAILGSKPERAYDELTELASLICGAPVSLVSLVGKETQFFKSARGLDMRETPREVSFCAHTLADGKALVVEDAQKDERFRDNPLVTGAPHLQSYAGSPIVDTRGNVLGTVCVLDDKARTFTPAQLRGLEILAKQASELLELRRINASHVQATGLDRELLTRLRVATEAGELGIFTWMPGSDSVAWENDRMYQIFGRSYEQGPTTSAYFIGSVVHPDSRDSFIEAVRAVRQEGDRLSWIGKLLHTDGHIRWVEFLGIADVDATGALRVVGTTSDVTSRKVTEEALGVERERIQLALIATEGTTFDWEPATDKVTWTGLPPFGVPGEQIPTGKASFAYVHPADAEGLKRRLEEAIAKREVYAYEYRGLWVDGSTHWVRTAGRVLVNDDGAVRVLGINNDITEQKLSEEALLHSEKLAAVGKLATTISHEINNPLEAVTNLLYILHMSPGLSQDDRDNLALADRELARVSQITAQTLRFHRSPANPTLMDASAMLKELLTLYRSRLTASNITALLELGERVRCHAYEGDIRQVINNLVGNAFDVMRTGGTLRVRTRCATDWSDGGKGIAVTIADTGAGMPEDTKARLFEAFYSTKGINGTGLGLWVSKRIVHKHKGHLDFRSRTGLKSGTVFRLWLPLEAASTAGEAMETLVGSK